MLVPPVAQVGTSGRQPGDSGARAAQSSLTGTATALWPIAPMQTHSPGSHEAQIPPSSAATPAPAHSQGINRYELYSLFPGSSGGSYVTTTPGTPTAASARAYHATTHKVSESVFSTAMGVGGVGGYTWGAPTPPPGSPYSPAPAMTQLEMLAKNLATLAPHHAQQSLSLQGAVGLNVGASLHHAHHTQHTLNLAGLHHLHHGESAMTTTSATSFTSKFIDERTLTLGGLHQSPFPPQLSLVTAGTPTLTINNFSSPSAQASVVPTSGGVLVQEYQSTGPSPIAGCQSSTSGSCSMTPPNGAAASNVSTVMVHGTTTGPLDTNFVQSTLTKKRESFIAAQGQTLIKMENKTASQSCICKNTNVTSISGKIKNVHSEAGCSRTLPVVSSWNSQDTFAYTNAISQSTATNLVKRESLAPVPCQVAEVSTSLHATTTAVKIEPLPSKSKNGIVVSTATTTGIPVGIAVARQRLQHQETSSTSLRNVSLNHHTSHHANYHHFQPDSLGSATAMAMGGATLLHCGASGDDRTSHLTIPSGALAPSINAATLHSGLGNIGSGAPSAWPPTLWQYPTTAMPALEPIGFPQVAGVGLQSGLQLVRDPTTGQLLLIHAAAEQMQQAVVWPNYANHGTANIGAPSPLLLPGPTPPSLQLLSDINGARLVLTENKRKQHNTMPIVKIEADCATHNPSATIIASTESNKALQTVTTMTGSIIPESPLLTTLHYYPHAPALVQISHAESTQCRTQQRKTFISKTTSPVSCLTPPPEITHVIEEAERCNTLGVQDASNQTDAPDIDDHFPTDGFIKQEPKFPAYNQSVITTCKSFDTVSSSIEQSRILNSNISDTSVIQFPSDVTNNMDESENIDIGDNHTNKSEDVNLVDQTIERVVSCKSNHIESGDTESSSVIDEDSVLDRRVPRFASRLIEITEENCDSFHENLEFFGERCDLGEQYRKSHNQEQEQAINQQPNIDKSVNSPSKDDEVNGFATHVSDQDVCNSISSTFDESRAVSRETETNEIHGTLKPLSEPSKASNIDSYCSMGNENTDNESDVIIKSLDMPFIDGDEQHQINISVKQELEEPRCLTDTHTMGLDNINNLSEKVNYCEKKQCTDKFYAGIENVVEKLKKNAAAAAEAAAAAAVVAATALQDNVTIDKSIDCGQRVDDIHTTQSNDIPEIIKLNNGLKKRILRLCEIASNTKDSRVECKETNKVSKQILNEGSASSNIWHSSENNNPSNSSNNNVQHTEENSPLIVRKHKPNDISKPAIIATDSNEARPKQKYNVDLSGLELLSESIAQLEQLKPAECSSSMENTLEQPKESNNNNKGSSDNNENNNNKNSSNKNNNVDSPLGLLCALAEQRFMEEVGHDVPKRSTNNGNSEDTSQAGILLVNVGNVTGLENSQDEEKITEKRNKTDDEDACNDMETVEGRAFTALNIGSKRCSDIMVDNVSNYSPQCEEDHDADDDYTDSETESTKNRSFSSVYNQVDHKIETGNAIFCSQMENLDKFPRKDDDSNYSRPDMNALELNMRERLADIQKKYKEKQMELLKLSPKKEASHSLGRSRKKSSDCEYLLPVNDRQEDHSPMESSLKLSDDIVPPLSPTVLAIPKCNVNLVKLGELRSHIKLLDSIPNIPLSSPPQTSPITVSPADNIILEDENSESAVTINYDVVSPTSTIPSSTSASKKRKVGRPRKFMCTSTSARQLTETIVAKKSRTKGSLISYLISSKNRQNQYKFNTKGSHNPLAFKTGAVNLKSITKGINKSAKSKVKPVKQTQLHNKNVICSIIAEKAKLSQEAKLEKQLIKWKPTVATEVIENVENSEINNESIHSLEESISNEKHELLTKHDQPSDQQLPQESPHELTENIEQRREARCEKLKKKKRKSTSSSPLRHKINGNDKKESKRRKSSDCRECRECAKVAKADRIESIENIVNRCKLMSAHLSIDQMRVLTAMGGLFYAGRLSAIQAPDIYAITLDGERGNRPHIHSREEILRDAIVEVCPTSTKQLPPGTRLCAYWSQQYRCLYPGTSVEPSDPDSELDEKFVSVEFDDGDSGKIALNDIRLLQPDYPVVEYDPNPLLTLGKRRRQTSTSTEDKRITNDSNPSTKLLNVQPVETAPNPSISNVNNTVEDVIKIDKLNDKTLDEYRERKKLKKRRRDKLKRLQDSALVNDGKRKHRKHKCCEEHRKHKHRKHRKHKRRHSHHTSYSEGSHFSGGDSCSGHISEGDIADENAIPENKISSLESELQHTGNAVVIAPLPEFPQPSELIHEKQVATVKTDKVKKSEKKSKTRERQESVESRSKMAAFLPARQLWGWSGKGYRRPGAKGRAKKQFFKAIQRGSEAIQIGDSAVFLSTGRPDRPYIGRIESMWETTSSNMIVKVKWFYHPEETVGAPVNLKFPGALFESPHMDENDVQTISHKCEVLPLHDYTAKLEKEPHRYLTIYDNNDIYYLAGYYDPTTYLLTLQPGVV